MINELPIAILNLPARTDRLSKVIAELPKLFDHLNFNLVQGIEGPNSQKNIVEAHKSCLRSLNGSGIVIEDDLVFSNSESLRWYANEALKNLPDDWEILSFGSYGGVTKISNIYWSKIEHFAGAHFLIYRDTAIDKVLQSDFGNAHYDRVLSSLCKCYVVNKMIAFQSAGYSDHRKKEVDDSHYLIGKDLL